MKVNQVSIRFEPDNYDWLKRQIEIIRPVTTLNQLVNFIVQQVREKEKAKSETILTFSSLSGDFIEVGKAE